LCPANGRDDGRSPAHVPRHIVFGAAYPRLIAANAIDALHEQHSTAVLAMSNGAPPAASGAAMVKV